MKDRESDVTGMEPTGEILDPYNGRKQIFIMRLDKSLRVFVLVSCCGAIGAEAHAQSFGVELHNTLMAASGGMAGASLARPQDLQSAINAKPATLTQFQGT